MYIQFNPIAEKKDMCYIYFIAKVYGFHNRKGGQNMLEQYPDILNVSDVAQILKVGQRSVYKLIHTGDLYSRKIGREYKIPKQNLISYLGG